jgi:hypothetical protein
MRACFEIVCIVSDQDCVPRPKNRRAAAMLISLFSDGRDMTPGFTPLPAALVRRGTSSFRMRLTSEQMLNCLRQQVSTQLDDHFFRVMSVELTEDTNDSS